jgi:immune inhibitor A
MRRLTTRKTLAGLAGVAVVAGGVAFATSAFAQPGPQASLDQTVESSFTDDLPNPYEQARRDARETAIAGVLSGKYQAEKRGASTVVNLDTQPNANPADKKTGKRSHYVEVAREATDRIFVILVEFGDQKPSFPLSPTAQRTEGPLRNQIPAPDRSVDNSTVWNADSSQQFFQDLYFGDGESLKHYMETQSSGRYSVDGKVTNWVKVNFTQGRYGTDRCGSNVCSDVKALVRDAANSWVNGELANGRTMDDIKAELATFDVWDRYDLDQDGNFNEPDGWLDHFQIVHAGGDEADGDPIYGQDAIWSHRWYSNLAYGPSCFDGRLCQTGTPIGGVINANGTVTETANYTGFYIGDYTIQPENGGRSVFYHEYTHDLGLPDDYSGSGCPLSPAPAGCTDNNNEHWTLMAQSRVGAASDAGIGERGADLGAWNKLQLGWLNYQAVGYNQKANVNLGPQEYNTNQAQALVVVLPEKQIAFDAGTPAEGDKQWLSGHKDNTYSSIQTTVTVPAGNPTLTFQTHYDIESGYDYAQVLVNGAEVTWWDGTQATYAPRTVNLAAYAGQTVQLSFTYVTDPAVSGNNPSVPDGVWIDDVKVGGTAVADSAWTNNGWVLAGTTYDVAFPHFYIAGYRSYVAYDQYLQTGPYYFGYGSALPDKVDHYAYQTGLLISYWDTSVADNDTTAHPGVGRNLYIDAHPAPMAMAAGPYGYWRARVQVYDAPFGTQQTDVVTLHNNGTAYTFGGLPGNPVFRDTDKYWFAELPNHGVKLPGYGVTIEVLNNGNGGKLQVKVNK